MSNANVSFTRKDKTRPDYNFQVFDRVVILRRQRKFAGHDGKSRDPW